MAKTFGKTDIGALPNSTAASYKSGCIFTLGENANITKISLYCKCASGTQSLKAAIYDVVGGNPNTLKAVQDSVGTVTTTWAWVDVPITVALVPGDYFLGVKNSAGTISTKSDTPSPPTNKFKYRLEGYGDAWSDPFGAPTTENSDLSIYATYTPIGVPCSDYKTQAECEGAGCYWYDGACHSTPRGKGRVDVYAVADSEEVTASFQVVETGERHDTPWTLYLDAGKAYTLRGSYEGQAVAETTPTITDGGTFPITFRFTKMHPVTITSEPSPVNFTLNEEAKSTPFSQSLPSGPYTLVFPSSWMVGVDEYIFTQWENGSTNPRRTVTLGSPEAELVATYRLKQVDEAGPINQRQMKDTLRQVFGQEGDISEKNPLQVYDPKTQAQIEEIATKLDLAEFLLKFTSTEALDDIAVVAVTPTTELPITVALPAGATIVRAMLAAFITAMNDTANAQKIDVDVQGRVAGGAWNTYFSQDDVMGFPAADGATTGIVAMQDVSALVVAAGLYGFRLQIIQSGAFSVHYTTQFLLIVTYRL